MMKLLANLIPLLACMVSAVLVYLPANYDKSISAIFYNWEHAQYIPNESCSAPYRPDFIDTNIKMAYSYLLTGQPEKAKRFYAASLDDLPKMKDWWLRGQPSIGYSYAFYHFANKTPMPANICRELIPLADRFASYQPYTGYKGDSQAESNAWIAAYLAVMPAALPNHPHASAWESAARKWAKASIVPGVTVWPNYLLDNHGHHPYPGYALCTICFLGRGALIYKMQGKPVPPEFSANVKELWLAHKPYIKNWRVTGADDWGTPYTVIPIEAAVYLYTLRIISKSELDSYFAVAMNPRAYTLTFPDAEVRATQRANGTTSAVTAQLLLDYL